MTRRFKSQIIAQLALLSAVAYVLLLLEFPVTALFPQAGFLKLNFSDMPALIACFAFGPLAGAIVTLVKLILFFFSGTSTAPGLGELANLIVGLSYVLPAAFIYGRRKNIKTAIIALAVSSVTMVVAAFLANLFILLPMYGIPPEARMGMIWSIFLPFNLIKVAGTSALTFLVYKPVSRFLRLFDEIKIKKVLNSGSPEQTEKIAFKIAEKCKGGEVYLVEGEMGAGKTVFAKGFAAGLGVTDTVTSPTFAIHNTYQGRLKLHHFDFYRIDEKEAETLGLDEFFGNPDSVCVVEWGSNVKGLLPENAKVIKINPTGENTRTVEIK